MSNDCTEEELNTLINNVLEEMHKHFSQEQDQRYQTWDIPAPHVKLGRPQEVHGRRPGKRKMVLALRAAAKAQGMDNRIPKWNSLIQMPREDVYRIGQREFGGRFDEVLRNMPSAGAGNNAKINDVGF